MKADSIREGMRLELKAERQLAYDWPRALVRVDAIRARNGYSTPFIYEDDAAFKPSDFRRMIFPS